MSLRSGQAVESIVAYSIRTLCERAGTVPEPLESQCSSVE